MAQYSMLSGHGRALAMLAADSRIRVRDIADSLGVSERAAQRILADLIDDGYVERNGRRPDYMLRSPELRAALLVLGRVEVAADPPAAEQVSKRDEIRRACWRRRIR